MNENEIFISSTNNKKSKFLGIFGSSSSGLGAFGAAHNVCHSTCQGIIALLAIFGLSAVGMPLGFLLDPYFVVIFSLVGLTSIALSIIFYIKHKESSCSIVNMTYKNQILSNKKLLVFLVLGAISAISLASGTSDILAKENTVDTITNRDASERILTLDYNTKINNDGYINIAMTYLRISNDDLIFDVTMDTSNMDAPPLTEYDLTKSSYIVGGNGITTKPLSWSVQETGHMGHHIKGTLVFSLEENNPIIDEQARSFEIVINDIGGISQRIFSWEII